MKKEGGRGKKRKESNENQHTKKAGKGHALFGFSQ